MFYITFIKKDVNKYLLLLIISLLVIYSWSNVYYEGKLKNISIEYEKKFQETTGKVVLANETISLKETFQKDREFFEEKYSNLNMENQELKNNNEKLQLKLNSVKSELEDAKAKFDKLYSQFQQVQNSLIKANGQISSLIYKNQELCRKLKEKGGEC